MESRNSFLLSNEVKLSVNFSNTFFDILKWTGRSIIFNSQKLIKTSKYIFLTIEIDKFNERILIFSAVDVRFIHLNDVEETISSLVTS